jgi:hypothetical protein
MDDDLKILPGQVTQLTTGPAEPSWEPARSVTRRRRGAANLPTETLLVPAAANDRLPWEHPTGPCQRCGERPATVTWAPDGTMGLIHGGYQFWCARCALRAQVEHARACAARLPELERQLAAEEAR